MSDEANDVTKALAAFGAPSIRYHSFGQGQIKPSSVVLPRRVAAPLPEEAAAVSTRQEEPVAAPEPVRPRPAIVSSPSEPVPAPVLRQAEPARMSAPSVAPPPRPLAEWAAPVAPPAPRPLVAAAPLVRASAPVPASPSFPSPVSSPVAANATLAASPRSSAPVDTAATSAQPGRTAPLLVAAPPPDHGPSFRPEQQKVVSFPAGRSLPEVFEFLANGPARAGASRA